MAVENALSAANLVDSFGVATHIDYTDGAYASIDKTLSALNYLGLDHVRDASPTPKSDPYGQGHLGDAAAAGIKFTFLAQGGEAPQDVVARLHQFIADHPGSITAIEGPNEVNNWQVNYNGLTGTAGAQAYQQALYSAVHVDPLLKSIPVLGFTDYPFNASASDYNNIHPYSNSGDQPREAIITNESGQAAVDPGKGFMITELGYETAVNTPGFFEGVDQTTQAKLCLNALMDAADLGSTRSYLYELLDEQPDASGTDQQAHFGLFNFDGTPKAAATAIHNLTSILSDSDAGGKSTSGSLDYSIEGLPTNGHSLLTVKSDGSYQIVAWNEPDLWDQDANHAIAPTTVAAKLQLGQTFASVQVFDPLVSDKAIATYASVSSVDLSLDGHPVIVQVSNPSDASATKTEATVAPEASVEPATVTPIDTSAGSQATAPDQSATPTAADPISPPGSAIEPAAPPTVEQPATASASSNQTATADSPALITQSSDKIDTQSLTANTNDGTIQTFDHSHHHAHEMGSGLARMTFHQANQHHVAANHPTHSGSEPDDHVHHDWAQAGNHGHHHWTF